MENAYTQQEYRTLDNYAHLNQLIKEWVGKFVADKESIHVAISRKAPRLLEWGLNGKLGSDVNVVTELALPFIDWKKESKCLVVDEAIYHGTTFEKVLSLLLEVNPDWESLAAMPLVVTTEALRSNKIESRLSLGLKIIEQREIPFFVDTIISKFFELGKPYDVEYPLFYIDFKNDITDEDLKDILGKMAQLEAVVHHIDLDKIDFYKTENYSRELNQTFSSFTYCTDYLYNGLGYGMAKPDFSKLRFFYKDKRLCVASMSPYIIQGQMLSRSSKMFAGDFLKVWMELYEVSTKNRMKVNTLFAQDKEYEYQWNKSMVMAANYLLSFNHFLKLRNALLQALGNRVEQKGFYQDKLDLGYLFGKECAEKLMPVLCQVESDEHTGTFLALGSVVKSVIPVDYQRSYNFQMGVDNLRKGQTENINLMLSSMFSSMHWLVEVQSRMVERCDYGRLRFGESYASILEQMQSATHFAKARLLHGIHRGIDQRIDRGSVVPNYVKIEDGTSIYWRRLFRSGENEDILKDQLLRIILKIVHTYFERVGRMFMTREALEYIFSAFYFLESQNPYLQKQIGVTLSRKLFGLSYVPTFSVKTFMYEMKVLLGNQEVGLLDYALDNDILKIDEFGYVVTSNSSYFERISTGTPLDRVMLDAIRKVVDFVARQEAKSNYALRSLNKLYEFDARLPLAKLREEVLLQEMDLLSREEDNMNLLNEVFELSTILLLRTSYLSEEQYDESKVYYAVSLIWKLVINGDPQMDENAANLLYASLLKYAKEKGNRMSDGKGCYNWLCVMGAMNQLFSLPRMELKARLVDMIK